jgi:hypothetical protein
MMHWIGPVMWGFSRALAWLMQLAGFAGILLAAVIAVRAFAAWIDG